MIISYGKGRIIYPTSSEHARAGRNLGNSHRYRSFIRQSAIRRHAVDYAREMLAELRQEVVGRHTRLAGHGLHLSLAENRLQLLRWKPVDWDRYQSRIEQFGLNQLARSWRVVRRGR